MGDQLMRIIELVESEKIRIKAEVEDSYESLKRKISNAIKSNSKDENRTLLQSTMKLEFRNGIAPIIKTGDEIKGEGDVPIEVALVDGVAGYVVDDEPESSAKVELVLLNGTSGSSEGDNWTAEEFDSSIVPHVEGGKPVLSGNVAFQLKRGVGVMKNVKIRNHAIKIKPPKFKLGARVRGSSRVKEAKTEPFDLKEYRVKYKEKRKIPSLSDEVWRLACIGKGGEIHKRLQESNVNTVEDFLIQLLINPQGLMTIAKSQAKKWKATVENARACLGGERLYCYEDPKEKRGVVFDILGHVVGMCSGSCYSHASLLSEEHKADAQKLLESAYNKWEEVKAFKDHNTLLEHLAGSSKPVDHASEMVKSSSYPSFHSSASTTNLLGEGGGQDLGSFATTVCDDIEVDYDAMMQFNHAWPSSPGLFEEGLDFYLKAYNETSAAAVGDDEAGIVGRRNNPTKIWRKLLCVLRVAKWLSVRKRVTSSM